ncbi:MAG TPA: RnfH family protein [Halomonas sp.]|nr:RnfH family protein [Halomonas sp.]
MADEAELITVEVAYALPERQRIVELQVPEGTTPRQAVAMARLDAHFPQLPPKAFVEASLGIFGKLVKDPDREPLRDGDRVEVYRLLKIDPKAARQARAQRQRQGR